MAAQSRTRSTNSDHPSRAWIAARQPLLLALFMGATLSIAASGRVSVRLVVDGAVSFAFVPIIELLAFAVVFRRGGNAISFAAAVDRFFAGNAPWLFALATIATITAIDTPQQTMPWTTFPRLGILMVAAIAAGIWSVSLDVRFFQSILRRSGSTAITDAILFRAIAWPLGAVYFLGYAIWPMLVQWSRAI